MMYQGGVAKFDKATAEIPDLEGAGSMADGRDPAGLPLADLL